MNERRKRTHISAVRRAAALRELADLGCSQIKASALMGCHRQLVNRICRKHGIEMPPAIDASKRKEVIQTLIARKQPRIKIAQALGVSKSRISGLLQEYGIEYSNAAGRPSAALTLRRVAAIQEFATLGLSQNQASILLDIEPCSVSHLCKRFKIRMMDKRGRRPILTNMIIRDYGKEGMTTAVMAERYSTTTNSVSATISRLRNEGRLPPKPGEAKRVCEKYGISA